MRRGAVVLCGGLSTRMGRDKAGLPFGRETLLQRVVRLVAPVVEEVIAVAGPEQRLPALPDDVIVVRDEEEGLGPLAGLAGGLSVAQADAVYATACDVPFLEPRVVEALFERLGDAHVAVIERGGFLHPLAAVYRSSVAPIARRLLDEGRHRPILVYDHVPTIRVDARDLRSVDPTLGTLHNLNTEADYERALQRLAAQGSPRIRIELYEVARKLTGVPSVEVAATTLGEALTALVRAHPGLEGRIIVEGRLAPLWRASVDGNVFVEDPETPLEPGSTLVLVSALAGG